MDFYYNLFRFCFTGENHFAHDDTEIENLREFNDPAFRSQPEAPAEDTPPPSPTASFLYNSRKYSDPHTKAYLHDEPVIKRGAAKRRAGTFRTFGRKHYNECLCTRYKGG